MASVLTGLRRAIDLAIASLVVAVLLVALTAYLAPAVRGRALAIRSGSMAPAIGTGSLVVALEQDPATLRPGDVVTIGLRGGTILTHRIDAVVVQDDRRMFRLKGDANPAADPVLVTQDELLGKVVLVLPLLGYLLAMMSMPVGVVALLSTGILLMTGAWLLDDVIAEWVRRERARRRAPTVDEERPDPSEPARGELGFGYDCLRGRR